MSEVKQLVNILPYWLRDEILDEANNPEHSIDLMIEIIMDAGRFPLVYYKSPGNLPSVIEYNSQLCNEKEITEFLSKLPSTKKDNRTGLEGTLHRVSVLPNRDGEATGLTIRIGREINDASWGVGDLLKEGNSLLFVGVPGSGKTTCLRSCAKYLSTIMRLRTMVVDNSDEICGFGNTPHNSVGYARKLAVPFESNQYEMMLQAVENHTPECLIVDEIGDEKEVRAIRSIAKRGIQMIATVHGEDMAAVMSNYALSGLLGEIKPVTLSDMSARERGTSKTVLERQYEPCFDAIIEIESHQRIRVIKDVKETIDAILDGKVLKPEVREKDGESFKVLYQQKLVDAPRSRRR